MFGALRSAITAENRAALVAVLSPRATYDALRELLHLGNEELDSALALMPRGLAAELIEEAPSELGAELMERMAPRKAANALG
ncbi:hypothetical protein [Roseivivax sp. CAU 1761]